VDPLTCPKCQGLISNIREAEGVVRPNFGSQPFFFPLIPNMGKVQIHKVLFSKEDPLCPLTFRPVFLLDRAFFFPYTLSIKKKSLIKLIGYSDDRV